MEIIRSTDEGHLNRGLNHFLENKKYSNEDEIYDINPKSTQATDLLDTTDKNQKQNGIFLSYGIFQDEQAFLQPKNALFVPTEMSKYAMMPFKYDVLSSGEDYIYICENFSNIDKNNQYKPVLNTYYYDKSRSISNLRRCENNDSDSVTRSERTCDPLNITDEQSEIYLNPQLLVNNIQLMMENFSKEVEFPMETQLLINSESDKFNLPECPDKNATFSNLFDINLAISALSSHEKEEFHQKSTQCKILSKENCESMISKSSSEIEHEKKYLKKTSNGPHNSELPLKSEGGHTSKLRQSKRIRIPSLRYKEDFLMQY